jgi:hypothetical protein
MSTTLDVLRQRYDRMSIPTIRVAFVLSLLLHALALTNSLPKMRFLPAEDPEFSKQSQSLAVRLAPRPNVAPTPPPSPAALPQPPPPQKPRASVAPKPQPAPPPVLSVPRQTPAPAPAPVQPPAPAARAPASDDFASMIESRRRAREPAPAATPSPPSPPAPQRPETERERNNRVAAENLGLNRAPTFGENRTRGGGIFQIERVGFDSAEFVFFGWNKFINRNMVQTVEVLRGSAPSIQVAMVRKMISIIREHESGTFVWDSRRLGRDVTLSAKPADNAELEAFLMQEFFPEVRSRN